MKKIGLSLFLTVAVSQAMDTVPVKPDWISIRQVVHSEFSEKVDAEVLKDKQLRRSMKDLEFLRNVMTYKYNIDSMAIDGLMPWVSKPVDRQNSWGPKYLAVDFSAVAPLIAVKIGGQDTKESVLISIMSLYDQAKIDRKKRKELALIGHILQPVSAQDPSFNFGSLKEMWFEEKRGHAGMMPMTHPAGMSSQSIIDIYNTSAMPSPEQPIKIDMEDVYTLLSQRFNVDYQAQVGVLKTELKALKAEQRYLTAAHRILKSLDPTNGQLNTMQDAVAPQQYQFIASLLGIGTFFKSELKDLLPSLSAEIYEKKTLSLLSEIVGIHYSTNGFFILKGQANVPQPTGPGLADLGDPQSLVIIKDGKLYRSDSIIADDMTHQLIYAVDSAQRFCIQVPGSTTTSNHDRFFTIDDVGQPLACGGHISVQGGKIVKIDPMSGHYMPASLQLFLLVKYLNKLGVISPDCVITSFASGDFSLKDVLSIAEHIELKA